MLLFRYKLLNITRRLIQHVPVIIFVALGIVFLLQCRKIGFPLICILLVLSGILLLRHSFAKHYKNWASPLHGERRMKEEFIHNVLLSGVTTAKPSHLIIGYVE